MSPFVPSLERISLIKVVTLLWNEREVHEQLSNALENSQWEGMKQRISEHVRDEDFEISTSLKTKILGLIEPIGNEISSWLEYHVGRIAADVPLKMPLGFHWKLNGTIDSQKTVEDLVRNEDIDATHRFFWACYYSLENEILKLWGKVDKTHGCNLAAKILSNAIVAFWTFKMDEDLTWIPSSRSQKFETLFRQSSSHLSVLNDFCYRNRSYLIPTIGGSNLFLRERHRYSVAAEYFWRKLSAEEDQQFSSEFSVRPLCQTNDVIYYIFSELDAGNQSRVLINHHEDILVCFLDWPRHTRFLEISKRCWGFLTEDSLKRLMNIILEQAEIGSEGYAELFKEFWNQCSGNCINILFRDKSNEIFELCSDAEKMIILSSFRRIDSEDDTSYLKRGRYICMDLFDMGYLELFKYFIKVKMFKLDGVQHFLSIAKLFCSPERDTAIQKIQQYQSALNSILEKRNSSGQEKNDLDLSVERHSV